MDAFSKKHAAVLICLVLVTATASVYWQVGQYDFVSFDDGRYVYENHHVRTGLSKENISWAFGFTAIAYWHPLTWLSHMLDCHLFGLNPGRHHLTNLIMHLINSQLLLSALWKMTGNPWKSAVVALLFALHPLNVESVVWVAERKNVLSTLFWMLTLLSYSFYATRPRFSRYVAVLFLFTLGLLAKPAIVSLPFVLLLLDFWPLNRLRIDAFSHPDRGLIRVDLRAWIANSNFFRLILEKVPFLLMSAVSIYISFLSAQHRGIVLSTHEVPLDLRLANGLVSYMVYIGKLIWPHKLAVFYPYPNAIPIWLTASALIWILCVSAIVLRWAIRMPYLPVGWFWYVGTLVPHIGLMQAGLWPAYADRWAYIPFIGLFITAVWRISHLCAGRSSTRKGLSVTTGIIVFIFALTTWVQTGYWKNNYTLYQRAIDVTRGNDVAHNNLGVAYFDAGKVEQAIYHFVQASRIRPAFAPTHRNLSRALAGREEGGSVIKGLQKLLQIYPEHPALHYILGNLYRKNDQLDKALLHYQAALVHYPDFLHAMRNQAGIYTVKQVYTTALQLLKQINARQPDDPVICLDIARLYALRDDAGQTIVWLERAMQNGFSNLAILQTDPQLSRLNADAQYRDFLNKTKKK